MSIEVKTKRHNTIKPPALAELVIRPLGLPRNLNVKKGDDYFIDVSTLDCEDDHQSDYNTDNEVEDDTGKSGDATKTFLLEQNGGHGNLTNRSGKLTNRHRSKDKQNDKNYVQLPMLKLNLKSFANTNDTEDNKTLESTRKTLRTLLEDSKQCNQTAQIKHYEFMTPLQSNMKRSEIKSKPEVDNKQCSVLKLPTVFQSSSPGIRTHHDISQRITDAISSVALTNQLCNVDTDSVCSEQTIPSFSSETNNCVGDLIIDLVDTPKFTPLTVYDMAAWPSPEDIQKGKRGINGCSKHEYLLKKHRFQQEIMDERIRARKDLALSWVNINNSGYKASPIFRYSTYRGSKMDTVSIPSPQPPPVMEHCPVCAHYKSDKIPTICPPNSPKQNYRLSGQSTNDEDSDFSSCKLPLVSTSPFREAQHLEPLPPSIQGFRGSKTPISFKIAFSK